MTKHRKKLGVILIVMLMSLIWFAPVIGVKAIVNGNQAKKPDNCNSTSTSELMDYYNIRYDWDEDGNTITFKSSKGEFRFIRIDTNFFTNSFKIDDNGFYVIDGHSGVVSHNKSVKLNIKNSARGASATVNLALSADSSPCDSLITYRIKKAQKQPTATFQTGNFEIVIPFTSDGSSDKVKDDNSANYDGVCKALRNGENYHNKISAKAMAEYENSTDAKAYYSIIAPSCFDDSKKALYVFDEASMIKVIESALTTFKTYYQLRSTSVIGGGNNDVTGEKFMLNFDDIKQKAIDSGHKYYAVQDKPEVGGVIKDNGSKFYKNTKNGALVKDLNEAFGMKCKTTANSVDDFSNLAEHKANGDYNIDANAKYYYGYDETTQSVTYNWFESKKETKENFCSKKCEEVVEVKYGPPVASKAGSCFEYQVQVTSRVKCTTHLDGKPPEIQPYCVPVPYCNDIPGHVHQAGANDQYMACVQSCDGGKYTPACSEQCYKEVYKGKKTSKNEKTVKSKKTYSTSFSWSGHHYFSGNSILWSGAGYAKYYYYFENGRTRGDHGTYVPESGFKKRLYANGETCSDPCFFSGCKKNKVYIDKAEFIKDYKDNLDAYSAAINNCKASASCTTKTATFTISTHYKNRKGSKITISYPLDTSDLAANTPESLDSNEEATKCDNDTKVKADNNIILGFGDYVGCYKHCGNGLQYHTRWSYPGTWLDEKHGGHSFRPKTGDDWELQPQKFCLTMDSQDVNSKWWRYYYGLYDRKNTTSFDEESVRNSCMVYDPQGSDSISDDDIEDWNINASTRKFGYYGWNFDIACFYALNANNTKTTTPTTTVKNEYCNTGGGGGSESNKTTYRIRTVDLKNLFPASESGSSTGTGTSASGGATRAPGFNWSKNASVLASNGKNPEYQSKPSLYAQQVQSLGYNVYSEDNLEYQFELTKAVLKDLKDGDRNYGNFTGDMVTQHGVHSYQSDAIRSGVFSKSGTKVLNASAIGCNNVDNYSSTDCNDNTKEEGE